MPCLLGKVAASSTAAGEAWKEPEMQMTQYLFHLFPWEGVAVFATLADAGAQSAVSYTMDTLSCQCEHIYIWAAATETPF